jgi:hypothetical protein
MHNRDYVAMIIAGIVLAALLFGLGSCAYNLSVDGRERKQQIVEKCLDNGYGGVINLSDGKSWVCTGAGNSTPVN